MENSNILETSYLSAEEIAQVLYTYGINPDSPQNTVNNEENEDNSEQLENASSEIPNLETIIREIDEELQDTEPIIPPNSPSLLVEESTSRFSSALWYDKVRTKSVLLAGVGGIGSYVAFLLSRVKPADIILYDPDIVETVNMSGQFYSKSNVGMYKVDSIASTMRDYSDYYSIFSMRNRFDADSSPSDIMICGFDNMSSRKLFFHKWMDHISRLSQEERKKCLFIDGRLAAEEFQVFCITGNDTYRQKVYDKNYLFSDAEADETICSYKQTSHCATMIGSIIVNLFVNFVANECEPLIPRDLPFLTTYDAERMFFKTELI